MLQLLAILAPVLGIAATIGFIWLVVCAFKESPTWGVLVLLLSPITAIVFAVKYWEDSKRPFLVYAGSSLAFVMLLVGSAVVVGSMAASEMAQGMRPDGTIPFQAGQPGTGDRDADLAAARDRADAITARVLGEHGGAGGTEVDVGERAASEPEQPAPQLAVQNAGSELDAILSTITPRAIAKGYVEIPFGEASRYVGERVKIVEHDGHEIKGLIQEVRGDRLLLRRRFAAGDVSFEIQRRDVKTLKLYRR